MQNIKYVPPGEHHPFCSYLFDYSRRREQEWGCMCEFIKKHNDALKTHLCSCEKKPKKTTNYQLDR